MNWIKFITIFQIRTKHKRTQQEDGDDKSGNKSSGSPRHFENEEDELEGEIDVDEYPSDDDCGDNDAWKLFHQRQLLIAFDWSVIFSYSAPQCVHFFANKLMYKCGNESNKNIQPQSVSHESWYSLGFFV